MTTDKTRQEMSKHTPGEWSIKWGEIIEIAGGIALVPQLESGEHTGNAYLIAAAPDLLEAAENALNVLIAACVPSGLAADRKAILHAQQLLRAAISKATGEA